MPTEVANVGDCRTYDSGVVEFRVHLSFRSVCQISCSDAICYVSEKLADGLGCSGHYSKTVVVLCSKRSILDHDWSVRAVWKRLNNQVE